MNCLNCRHRVNLLLSVQPASSGMLPHRERGAGGAGRASAPSIILEKKMFSIEKLLFY